MSDLYPISVHPDSKAQKQQIEAQAEKHDESVSEYCLMAIEQRVAREMEAERLDDLEITTQLKDLKTAVTADIAAATDVSINQEPYYEVALWDLLASEFSSEERRQAMQKAPDKVNEQLEKLAEKESGDDQ